MQKECCSLPFPIHCRLFSCFFAGISISSKYLNPSKGYGKRARLSLRLPELDNERAFTLLEVMVAVSIIAIALVALFGSQSRSLSHATEAHFNIVAPMLASGKLAELESWQGCSRIMMKGILVTIFRDTAGKSRPKMQTLTVPRLWLTWKKPLQKVELTVLWSETKFSYSLTYYGRWQE